MKRASSLGPLPTELVHMIFRLLEDNKENLLKVSVVSKVWRAIALPLLFTSLSLKSSRQFHRLFKFVKSYPSLAGCVSTLSLRERVTLVSYYGMPVVNAVSPTLDLPQLAKIMYQLPKLRSLVLENVAPTWSPAASKVPRWSSLKRIEVRGDVPILALPMLLDIFTAVDEVRFGDMPLSAEDYREIFRKYDGGVRIPRLAIASNAAAMLGPLQEMIVWDALTSLTIAIGDEQHLTLLSDFLLAAARAGAPVTSLDIDLEPLVRNMVTDEEYISFLPWDELGRAFSACRDLRTLRIAVPTPRHSEHDRTVLRNPHNEIFPGIFSLESECLPRTISEVTLSFTGALDVDQCCSVTTWHAAGMVVANRREPVLWGLGALDDVLSSQSFTLLGPKSVKVELDASHCGQKNAAFLLQGVKNALPKLQEGGRLRIVVDEAVQP
ncbi:hypothetical protein C8Q76DRAFT_692528 [Earliella scabrosa]|nr:hypothetical protein C8Q76DRAFT_692528 [Earliella scabrosa]